VEVLKNYARSEIAGSEINALPPKLKLALQSRSMLLKKVFWKAVQRGALPVAMRRAFLTRARLASIRDGGGRKDGKTSPSRREINPTDGL
jgi:hypothetical protein